MSAPPVFPDLRGLGWGVKMTPSFSTRVAQHVSGRTVRLGLYARPLYQFELVYEGLDAGGDFPGLTDRSLQALMGFYIACQGQLGTFVYPDPLKTEAKGQAIGLGDGATTAFSFQRDIGPTTTPASYVTYVGAVYINGIATSGWTLNQPNTLIMTTAPAANAVITADFNSGYLCRFLDDQVDFEEFMNGVWQVESLKFISVR